MLSSLGSKILILFKTAFRFVDMTLLLALRLRSLFFSHVVVISFLFLVLSEVRGFLLQ